MAELTEAAIGKAGRTFHLPDRALRPETFYGLELEAALQRRHIDLEIGCGVGWHPVQVAQAMDQNECAMIAIERTSGKFDSFKRRLTNHPQLSLVLTAIQTDAYHFIEKRVPDCSLAKIWMLYPNPEIKRPAKRWYQSPTFRRALRALRPQGKFLFATNIADYAENGERFAPTLGLKLIDKRQINNSRSPNFSPRTHFELKYFKRGEMLFDYVFEKTNKAP